MRMTWSEYAQAHRLDDHDSHRFINMVKYWLETRGYRLDENERVYTDREWTGAVESARIWWRDLVIGTFADWS